MSLCLQPGGVLWDDGLTYSCLLPLLLAKVREKKVSDHEPKAMSRDMLEHSIKAIVTAELVIVLCGFVNFLIAT